MSVPPGFTPGLDPDLAGNHEGESLRLLQAQAATVCRDLGLRVSGSRVRQLVRQFALEGHADALEFPAWVNRRGDILNIRTKRFAGYDKSLHSA